MASKLIQLDNAFLCHFDYSLNLTTEGAAAPVNCTAGSPLLVTGGGIVKKGELVTLTLCAKNEDM